MNSDKKVLFFDIDGTLMDQNNQVPESAKQALRLAGEGGHLRFLCTGRTLSMLPAKLLELNFDGIVAGAGTYVRIGDRILLDRELTPEEVMTSLSWLCAGSFGFLYEGRDCVHVMPWEHYRKAELYREHVAHIGAPYEVIDPKHPERIHTAKFSVTIEAEQWEYGTRMIEALKEMFDVVIHQPPAREGSSRALSEGLAEFLPKGCNKAIGIQTVLEGLGCSIFDAYAFGDSNNDLEMLSYVGHSICMGNGTAKARKAAEYITTDIHEDGIRNAMLHYGLITEAQIAADRTVQLL